MSDSAPIVELSTWRDIDAARMVDRAGVLSFTDVGIDDVIARARLVTFNVFCGSHFGNVPVLRLATAFDRGLGLCLSQVMTGSDTYPTMGKTAIVSSLCGQPLENEKEIALTAFLHAKAA